jgi:hypothetical protein
VKPWANIVAGTKLISSTRPTNLHNFVIAFFFGGDNDLASDGFWTRFIERPRLKVEIIANKN